MNERIRHIGNTVLGLVLLLAFCVLGIMFVKGSVWMGEHVMQSLVNTASLVLVVDLIILLPLAIFSRLRPWIGLVLYISSYLFGLVTWFLGLLLTYTLWGLAATVVGLVLAGVGVVAMGILATLFKGMWPELMWLIIYLAVTFGIRAIGIRLTLVPNPFRPAKSRKGSGMPNWLRWGLMLPVTLAAYILIQLGVGLASEALPYPDNVQNWFSQFLNSLLGPWALVYTGAKRAPRGRALHAAIGLAVLCGLITLAVNVMAFTVRSTTHPSWWLVGTSVITLFVVVVSCLQVAREERNGCRQRAAEQSPPALPADDAEIARMQAELKKLERERDLLEDPKTICSFGQMAYDGDGVEQDFAEAAGWYKIAAEQGDARAQHNLASMYENGEGVPRDVAEAAKWYRMAADQGHAGSQNNLATLYESGEGVPQDHTIALDLYRQAAKGGDENAASNAKRLEALLKGPIGDRKRYEKMVFAFSDLMAEHSPLIGDCALLPYPKGTLLYAIRWVMDEYETNREATGNEELRQAYDKMLPTLSYLFTRLARDWQEIDPTDKDAIGRLRDCESFPEWAVQYKRKYIDDERASKEAAEVAFQVMKDRIAQEKSEA